MNQKIALADTPEAPAALNVLCGKVGEDWRIYVQAGPLTQPLRRGLDRKGEAYPVLLDFEDLDRQMAKVNATYEKHVSTLGDVELTAHGSGAKALSEWLSTALASGVR